MLDEHHKCISLKHNEKFLLPCIHTLANTNGSLLNTKVEVDSLAGCQCLNQRGKFGRRGRVGKRAPTAYEPMRRGQPGPYRAQ
jgi:hypothetical protein